MQLPKHKNDVGQKEDKTQSTSRQCFLENNIKCNVNVNKVELAYPVYHTWVDVFVAKLELSIGQIIRKLDKKTQGNNAFYVIQLLTRK